GCRVDATLSGHHSAGAPSDCRAARLAEGFWCLHVDYAARGNLLPGRRHSQYRAIVRGPGGDRDMRGGNSTPLWSRAARGHAFFFELRQHAASAGAKSGTRGEIATRSRARPDGGWGDASRYSRDARDHRARLSIQLAEGWRECSDLSKP